VGQVPSLNSGSMQTFQPKFIPLPRTSEQSLVLRKKKSKKKNTLQEFVLAIGSHYVSLCC